LSLKLDHAKLNVTSPYVFYFLLTFQGTTSKEMY